MQVVAVHDRIADADEGNLGIAPQVLTVGVTNEEVYGFGEQETANAFSIR